MIILTYGFKKGYDLGHKIQNIISRSLLKDLRVHYQVLLSGEYITGRRVKLLNEIQNTRRYRPKLVDEIYHKNLYRLGKYLNNAVLLRSE